MQVNVEVGRRWHRGKEGGGEGRIGIGKGVEGGEGQGRESWAGSRGREGRKGKEGREGERLWLRC